VLENVFLLRVLQQCFEYFLLYAQPALRHKMSLNRFTPTFGGKQTRLPINFNTKKQQKTTSVHSRQA